MALALESTIFTLLLNAVLTLARHLVFCALEAAKPTNKVMPRFTSCLTLLLKNVATTLSA